MIDEAHAGGIAARLAGTNIRAVTRHGGGGNSRIFRVEAEDGRLWALKAYPSRECDPRDRLGHEQAALDFLSAEGAPVPRVLAADPLHNASLLDWIAGEPPPSLDAARRGGVPFAALADFTRRLHELRHRPTAPLLPIAVEACLSGRDLLEQVERRRRRLKAVDDGALDHLLSTRFDPAFDAARERLLGVYGDARWSIESTLEATRRTLSPSDFGFHNMLCRPVGPPVFIDFEYFGWDDPVKLTADVLWHPGMALSAGERDRWVVLTAELYSGDATFIHRLAAQIALFGLRWIGIVLSEFLSERWAHRVAAGAASEWREAKRNQSIKAGLLLDIVERMLLAKAGDWPNAFATVSAVPAAT